MINATKSMLTCDLCFVLLIFFIVISINSLTLSGFPLTSFHRLCFHLAEASLPAFSWLYTLLCAVVQEHHEFYCIYSLF